jgi:hypothetical protein
VLRGTAVMNGSARGTALVILLAGVPALACSMLLAARGSAAALITWLGSAGFLLYNSLMFIFATPANRLFPLYLAMLALAAWSVGAVLRQADVAAFGALFSPRTPVRGIAVYMWVTVALNAAAWLARIVPAVVHGGTPAYLRGAGRDRPDPGRPAAARPVRRRARRHRGAGLIRDGFGMPDGWLAGTPLTGWVLPGVALLIGVAVPQLAAAALIGSGARPGLAAGYLAGLLLIAWIAVELLILRRYFFLQPVIAGIGAAEILLAWRWQRSGKIVTGPRDQRP